MNINPNNRLKCYCSNLATKNATSVVPLSSPILTLCSLLNCHCFCRRRRRRRLVVLLVVCIYQQQTKRGLVLVLQLNIVREVKVNKCLGVDNDVKLFGWLAH